MEKKKLTSFERAGLDAVHNLADGHAQQALPREIGYHVEQLQEIFREAGEIKYSAAEQRFLVPFFNLANADTALVDFRAPLLFFSASQATELIAHVLKRRGGPVGLLEPTFDNIPDILRRLDLSLMPLPDFDRLKKTDLQRLTGGALFIVLPNNPTGTSVAKDTFVELCKQCLAGCGKILLLA